MNISEVLVVLRSYPAFDIEKADGTLLRRQVKTGNDTGELLQSYTRMHGRIRVIPKRKQGSAYVRDTGSTMEVSDGMPVGYPLGGFDGGYQPAQLGYTGGDMYRVMWENERENAREYREKYEKTLEELRKLEVEHASSKNSAIGDIVSGLAGVVPSLMGLDGGGALGSAPKQAQPANLQPVKDNRLLAIVSYYQKLDEPQKGKVYNLLARVFQNIDSIDSLIEQL